MSLAEAWQNIEQHLKADAESVATRIANDLPIVADAVTRAASNPVLVALEQAEHLTMLPEAVTLVVNFINGLNASVAAAKAQAAAEAQAAEPAPDAPPA